MALLMSRFATHSRLVARTIRSARLVALCLAALASLLTRAQAQVTREYDLKAVFLLNFAQFVEWPGDAFAGEEGPFVIGVLGSDPFQGALEKVIRNERVRARPVLMHRCQSAEEAKGCHILFISANESRRFRDILRNLRGRPVLTVSEADGFLSQGGMIRFVTENGKVRLQINNEAARGAGLLISAKLLRVAEVITTASRE